MLNSEHKQCTERKKEEIFLFNDALNTFYLRLYGVSQNGKEALR